MENRLSLMIKIEGMQMMKMFDNYFDKNKSRSQMANTEKMKP